MHPTLTPSALYDGLARTANRGFVPRQFAFMATGWLALFGFRPRMRSTQPFHLSSMLLGSIVIIGGLMLVSATVLSAAQPLLIAVGGLTLERAVVGVLVLFFLSRYLHGRSLLRAYMASQDVVLGGANRG